MRLICGIIIGVFALVSAGAYFHLPQQSVLKPLHTQFDNWHFHSYSKSMVNAASKIAGLEWLENLKGDIEYIETFEIESGHENYSAAIATVIESELESGSFDLLMESGGIGNSLKVFANSDGGVVNSLVILTSDSNDFTAIDLHGQIELKNLPVGKLMELQNVRDLFNSAIPTND